jgi:tetratricopeptide (TPR) repeat protein
MTGKQANRRNRMRNPENLIHVFHPAFRFYRQIIFLLLITAHPIFSENMKTADQLYLKKEYELANLEYMRLYLNGVKTSELKSKLALSFMRRGEFKKSLEYLDTHLFESGYLRLYASLKSGFTGMAGESYLEIARSGKYSADEKSLASLLAGTLFLERGEYDNAWKHYEMILKNSENPDIRETGKHVLTSLDEFRKKRKKSKLISGILSGIVPGSGQFYSGHYTDGTSAFLINGILIGSAVYMNRTETGAKMSHEGSIAMGLIALVFYSANIAGAIASAGRYNIYQERNLHQEIRDRFFHLDKIEKNTNLSFKTSF